ncbi:transporter, major facilitator family protein [Candidatus Nitrosopumilus salaria BD31]|uniref:Transporter, major facilitator family protein n=1 Tax=Candidatus Nitrosopumilus salarius BD31 TaxID=859350 RepID=I3D1Z4_9ARCH|nr:MFS transporter [Candidatus Nitrosopumilus salaria]EIJ65737.1 transporter, major facilitator family protein [Candidatus Nitrosopumilus salaria BD31]
MSVGKETANRSSWAILGILSCLGLIVMFDETMILPAIPDFIQNFNISYSTSSWLLSAYIIAAAVMTPIGGKLSDIYGKKRILLAIMATYTIGIVLGRFATNIEFMLVARALQGIGMAMFPIAFGVIREVLPENKFATGQTIFSSTFPAGAILGLIGGAAIIQNFGWSATFLAILPVAIVLWVIIFKFLHVKSLVQENSILKQRQTLDITGTMSLASAIILFLSGVTFLESGALELIATLFAASVASLVLFILIEKRAASPLLDFSLMRSKSFLPPTIVLMLTFLSIFMVYITIPVLVRSPKPLGFGGDALAVAEVQLPFMIVFLISTIMSGFVLNKIKNTRLTLIGTVISTMGFAFLFLFSSTSEMVSVGLTILAVGLSLSITGGFNTILVSVPISITGVALGMTLLLNLVGMSVGPAVSGIIQQLYQGTVDGVVGYFPTHVSYDVIFITAALISIASVLLALLTSKNELAVPNVENSH